MVLLTMTPAAVRALTKAAQLAPDDLEKLQLSADPLLAEPKAGNAVSHGQLIGLSKLLKKHASEVAKAEAETDGEPLDCTLESLLRGSQIYIPPPPPKKEPASQSLAYATPEFKALMARLRAEEEAKAYERMINPPPAVETFSQRFPTPQFSIGADNPEDDDVSFEEVHRQIILIINVLVSIVACGIFIWVAARHWTVGKRLGLSMGGSGAIAIAEVVVYSGYVRRVREAKQLEKKKPEIKEIVKSWVIDKETKEDNVPSSGSKEKPDDGIRYRKGKHR
ncbi:hypothetical protein BS50DRAFT_636572 [Corynespora cassiicola Philippines]|uniref:Uncharacterized protein n=1 Tax=Corynespora cassiicola Philippines TaxID=1448308 RepID=A0A2T2NG11_CORCC|nr:hypothetical protein BS50DRAFT_636572 [Corynespora cassiicola Philippines]